MDSYKINVARSSLIGQEACVVVTVSAELRPLPGLVTTFLGGERVRFLEATIAGEAGSG